MVRSFPIKAANYFLRKHRKWPFSPYKTKWHRTFNEHQALRILKQAAKGSPPPQLSLHQQQKRPDLLPALLHSFNTYNCSPTPIAYHFVFKTLIQTSQFHQIPSVLDRLERDEKFETPELIFTDLIKMYGRINKMHDAIDLFFRIPKFRCAPSVSSLNSLLLVLCRNSEGLKMVPDVLLKSQLMRIRLEESSFRVLIAALCRTGKVGYAIEMLNYMINDGYDPDMTIHSMILSSLCEHKGITAAEVKVFLEDLRRKGFCPGVVDYSSVIWFLVKEGSGLDALDMLSQMKSDGYKPDIVCYTMVLSGVIEEGDYAKADELFDELLLFGLVPDVYAYNVFIHGLCKQNNLEGGIRMISCMDELGCQPNVITYNTLLDALCKTGELARAKDLVKKMELKGVGPNLRTYKIMLDGLTKKAEYNEACFLMEEMLEKGSICRCSVFDEVIVGLCQRGLVSKALELLEKMVGKNVSPGARVWEVLLHSTEPKLVIKETILTSLMNFVDTE